MELSSLWMMKGRLSSQPSTTLVVYKVSENRLDSPLLLLPVGESNPQANGCHMPLAGHPLRTPLGPKGD